MDETTAVHPRDDFKNEFLQAFVDGLRHRPETTNGTLTSDVLEHFHSRLPAYDHGRAHQARSLAELIKAP
ncbi:hypothetical protein [Streptomyces sp. NPDC003393]